MLLTSDVGKGGSSVFLDFDVGKFRVRVLSQLGLDCIFAIGVRSNCRVPAPSDMKPVIPSQVPVTRNPHGRKMKKKNRSSKEVAVMNITQLRGY